VSKGTARFKTPKRDYSIIRKRGNMKNKSGVLWDEIEEEGRKAFEAGVEVWDNPYEAYSENSLKWSRGWNMGFSWLWGQI
jgi:hypothetical protein